MRVAHFQLALALLSLITAHKFGLPPKSKKKDGYALDSPDRVVPIKLDVAMKLRDEIRDARPPVLDTHEQMARRYAYDHATARSIEPVSKDRLKIHNIGSMCGCPRKKLMSFARVFNSTEKPVLDFIPVAASGPSDASQLTVHSIVAVSRMLTTNWEATLDPFKDVIELEMESGEHPIKASSKVTFWVQRRLSDHMAFGRTVSTAAGSFFCPDGYVCQVFSLTWFAKYRGDTYRLPTINNRCLRRNRRDMCRKLFAASKPEDGLSDFPDYTCLANLKGVDSNLDDFAQEFFTLVDRKTLLPVSKLTGNGVVTAGVMFPPKSVLINNVFTEYRAEDTASMIIATDRDEPFFTVLLVAWKGLGIGDEELERFRGASQSPHSKFHARRSKDLLVYALDSNIPGAPLDRILANGTVVQWKK